MGDSRWEPDEPVIEVTPYGRYNQKYGNRLK